MVERIHEQASKEAMLSTTSPIALCQVPCPHTHTRTRQLTCAHATRTSGES
jgi:hypothetical protein